MRTRFWISIAAVAAIAVGSVIAAIATYDNDKGDFNRVQSDDAGRAAHQAEAVAALSIGKLSTAAAIVQTQGRMSRHEFRVIGRSLLENGALEGAAYVPRVTASHRGAFERAVGIEISERSIGPLLRRAAPRPAYYPVTFGTSELDQPQRVRGFDLGSDPLRARVLQRAGDTGMAVATPLVRLLIGGTGINVFRPIYEDGAPVKTPAERRRALKGFIAGSFRVHDVAAAALAVLPGDAKMQLVVNHRAAFGPDGALEGGARAPIHIADRTWLLVLEDPGGPSVGLPVAIGILGIALAALLASLIVSWSRGERMRELERQASQDSLTGLGNRRRFEEDLAAAMSRSRRDGTTGALLMLDLDRFKQVNDSHGHPEGDRVIKAVAESLRERTRASDSLARLGGDEFAVILPRCSAQEALIAAEGIAAEIRQHHSADDRGPLTVSIGVALFGGDAKASVATVVSDADAAMYAAKDDGRDRVRVFEPIPRVEDASGRS
ncbi:MAG TPA: diguanylate cyclase [Solirubrobacterales bacterium]|nr:diguanylate cyclase [Solirubrobacterales bacterium]